MSDQGGSSWIPVECHCRYVIIYLRELPKKVNECRCTVCYKLGALWSYFPRRDVEVRALLTPEISLEGKSGLIPPGGSPPEFNRNEFVDQNIENRRQIREKMITSLRDSGATQDQIDECKPTFTSLTRAQYVYYDPVTSEGLDVYIRTDLENLKHGKNSVAFMRCRNCGVLTHWWGTDDDGDHPEGNMGVNARLLPEAYIWGEGVEREVTRC